MEELTLAAANKVLEKYKEDLQRLYDEEYELSTYVVVTGHSYVVPDYDFTGTRQQIIDLTFKIRKIKHRINVISSTTVLEKFGITIDEAIEYIPMLVKERNRLESMIVPLDKRLRSKFESRVNQVEYDVVNYNVNNVRIRYDAVCSELNDLELELNTAINTVTFTMQD